MRKPRLALAVAASLPLFSACAAPSPVESRPAQTAEPPAAQSTTSAETLASSAGEDAALGARVDAAVDSALAEHRIVGAVVLVARDGRVVVHRARGLADREANRAMREDDVFRLASLSKLIVSAAAMALIEQGALSLEDPVTKWLPDFRPKLADGRTPVITVRQLLTHTSGLGYAFLEPGGQGPYHRANISDGLDQPGLSFAENVRRLASVPLLSEPGTAFHYSLSIDVLGEIVARAGHGALPEVVARLVTRPLSMNDTGFSVADPSRLTAAYADGKPEPSRMKDGQFVPFGPGGATFAPSRALTAGSYPSGGAGIDGTAADFLKLLETLRKGGGPVLKPETTRAMFTDQIPNLPVPDAGEGWGFGFGAAVLRDPAQAKLPMNAGTFRWGGAYGHYWWVDPQARLSVVMLTNTAFEGMAGKITTDLVHAVYGR